MTAVKLDFVFISLVVSSTFIAQSLTTIVMREFIFFLNEFFIVKTLDGHNVFKTSIDSFLLFFRKRVYESDNNHLSSLHKKLLYSQIVRCEDVRRC